MAFFIKIYRTVRIWHTDNPKKCKTVIKTKNKQGKDLEVIFSFTRVEKSKDDWMTGFNTTFHHLKLK